MIRSTEQLLLPPILSLDRELCMAMNRIEQLTTEIHTYETYETTIERMEKRLRNTMKRLKARIQEVTVQIRELELEWISELNAHVKRIKKRGIELKRLSDQEQKSGNSDVKKKMEHNVMNKKDEKTEIYGVRDNYQKSISCLGSAVSALDDGIRFREVFKEKDKTEVYAIRASLNDFVTRLSDQMSTSLSSTAAANKNINSTSLTSGSNLVSLVISKTKSNNEKTDATQVLTFPTNSSSAPMPSLATPTPVTKCTPTSAVFLSSSTTSIRGNKDPEQSDNHNLSLLEPQREAN